MSLERVTSGEAPRFILLLPPPPSPPDLSALKAAYGETFSEVLKEVATHSSDSPKAAVLEIALACPHLVDSLNKPRSTLYDQTQSIIAGVYKLIVATAAQEEINVEDADGVDARIIMVAWSSEKTPSKPLPLPYGPVIDIETLAKCGRQWQFAFGVDSEAGESMVRDFVSAKGSPHDTGAVTGKKDQHGTSSSINTVFIDPAASRHYDLAVGGTWDHLHIGHKLLITMTIFAVDEREGEEERTATIGITGDQLLVKKKHAELVESWADRQKAVATFFNAIVDFSQPATPGQRHVSIQDDPGPNGKSIDIHYPNNLTVKCTEIQDPFGPTITEPRISALVISAETRAGGKAVNDKRKEFGWNELDVFEVEVLDAEEDEEGNKVKQGFEGKISSTAIREKLASKNGRKA